MSVVDDVRTGDTIGHEWVSGGRSLDKTCSGEGTWLLIALENEALMDGGAEVSIRILGEEHDEAEDVVCDKAEGDRIR